MLRVNINNFPFGLSLSLTKSSKIFNCEVGKKCTVCLINIRSNLDLFFLKNLIASILLNTIFLFIFLFLITSIPLALLLNLYSFCKALIKLARPQPISKTLVSLLKLSLNFKNLLNSKIYFLDDNQVLLSQFFKDLIKAQQLLLLLKLI